ncbi:TetR/AcrR family transcriptional regulator (plasmid) [Lichenicola cladoniae]|uniref:TetR/AcrR family transcriptional regulator n=1 Tax=Lichenicola cladoniae TaxID=1484109 RepID=A0A6M8HZ28_9PROT|nr:TetR/AcrR family transcriptional regulator [Lichenicola cladoniae]NPD67803.1 TetR/AcrR family transcriptional regulator [Acetobacteraceae bacterium]QKE93351.1 TetR/AcrR family transcriptional regulator [Lichenicola cladoniae]
MKKVETAKRRTGGRPLSFDREVALRRAMHLFWRYGYEGTSLHALTEALGVTPPSIYTAFGDKKQLFLEAMRRYAGDPADMENSLAAAQTARDAVHEMLVTAAIAFTGETTPKGCLLASATASGSQASADVRSAVSEVRRGIAMRLAHRIDQDIAVGKLPALTNAAALSDLILAVVQGMSVLARDDAPRERLLALAEQFMLAWPDQQSDRKTPLA